MSRLLGATSSVLETPKRSKIAWHLSVQVATTVICRKLESYLLVERQCHHNWCWVLWLRLHLLQRVDRSWLLRPRHLPDQGDMRPRKQLHRPVFRYWGVTLSEWKLYRESRGLPAESWFGGRRRSWGEVLCVRLALLGLQVVRTSLPGSLPLRLLLSSNMSLRETQTLQLDELLHRWISSLFQKFLQTKIFQETLVLNPAASPMAAGAAKCRKSRFLTPLSWTETPTPTLVSWQKPPQKYIFHSAF